MAKSASVVLHIVNTYGFWQQQEEGDECSERQQHGSTTNVLPVRVSSDTLMRRPSLHNSFRLPNAREPDDSVDGRHSRTRSRSADARERKWRELNDEDAESASSSRDRGAGNRTCGGQSPLVVPPVIKLPLRAIDERGATTDSSGAPVSHGVWVAEAARVRDPEQVLAALKRDHYRADTTHLSDHYVVCSGVLTDALALVRTLRRFSQHEHDARVCQLAPEATAGGNASLLKEKTQQLSVAMSIRSFVLLVDVIPSATSIMGALEEVGGSDDVLESVYFVCGSASASKDLIRAGAPRARRVVILPDESASPAYVNPTGSDGDSQKRDGDNTLADYGVVSAMLALEIAQLQQQRQGAPKRSPVSPRRLRARRSLSISEIGAAAGVDATAPSFQREVEQGLPVESVKLRMLERFPDLDPSVFREKDEVIEARLHRELDATYLHSQSANQSTARSQGVAEAASTTFTESTLGVILHTNNARFCRPCDRDVGHDEYPYLAPSFASGTVFLSSVLDRIVCQSFYNPYITDVVESLAAGSFKSTSASAAARRQPLDSPHTRLFRIKVDASFVGSKFLDVFLELLRFDVLAIGILRAPDPVLENLLPHVYTCPDPETVLHANDRLFVVG